MKYWFALPILLSIPVLSRGADAPPSTPAPAITPADAPTPAVAPPAVAPTPKPPGADTPAPPAETPAPPAEKPTSAESPTAPTAPKGETAVVRQNHVNVRGQAKINSEVVVRLNKGDHVVVINEITLPSPKTDEPAKWSQIALPASAPVWIHNSFIDPATKTVKATRLNLRSGPGENYSVLGRLEKGAPIKELETKGSWLKIEPPANAYAYVASHLLEKPGAAPGPEIAANNTTPPQPKDVPAAATNATPSDLVATAKPATQEASKDTTEATAPPKEAVSTPVEEELAKRVVSREGFVRRSVSIQAPTYFVLESKDTRKTINYLYSPPSNNIALRNFEGQRILVTGEELLDERWPNTPVINVETLKSMP